MLQNDIRQALDEGGQTIGGWGGSFYYWNSAFQNPSTGEQTTIGQYISSNPAEYEKFVAVNAFALSESLKLAGNLTAQDIANETIGGNGARSIWDVLYGTSGAQVPLSIRIEILSRALGSAVTGTYAGNPESIDGWTRNSTTGVWEKPTFVSEFGEVEPIEADASTAARLDAIRAERMSHQEQGQFSTPDLGPHASIDPQGNSVYQFALYEGAETASFWIDPSGRLTQCSFTDIEGGVSSQYFTPAAMQAALSAADDADAFAGISIVNASGIEISRDQNGAVGQVEVASAGGSSTTRYFGGIGIAGALTDPFTGEIMSAAVAGLNMNGADQLTFDRLPDGT